MGGAQELKGPDLAGQGIDAASLKEGEPLLGHAGGEAVVLVKQGNDVCALAATCSHYGGPLAEGIVENGTIRCPWHHARVDLRTGAATRPGRDPIACYQVDEAQGRVRVGGKLAPAAAPKAKGPASATTGPSR
jgi:nitrite reductase/ring-hydroxylating ferredoxin subunit